MKTKPAFPVPEPGALDQKHAFDVSLRVELSGKPEIVNAELRSFFERELPLHLPSVQIKRIRKVT